jgi:general stress protein 26
METVADRHEHLHEILEDFGSAMLVTHSAEGGIHARPMRVAELKPDGDLLFVTSLESTKVAEIAADSEVCVTFQSRAQFAAVYGIARVERDRALIERLWSPEWKVWFPRGKDDPSICLIRVDGRHGEYWDNAGAQAVKYAWEATKNIAQGKKPKIDDKLHAKVKL